MVSSLASDRASIECQSRDLFEGEVHHVPFYLIVQRFEVAVRIPRASTTRPPSSRDRLSKWLVVRRGLLGVARVFESCFLCGERRAAD